MIFQDNHSGGNVRLIRDGGVKGLETGPAVTFPDHRISDGQFHCLTVERT